MCRIGGCMGGRNGKFQSTHYPGRRRKVVYSEAYVDEWDAFWRGILKFQVV